MTMGTLAIPEKVRDSGDMRGGAIVRPAALTGSPSALGVAAELSFGDFRFVPRSRELLRDGRSVCVGSRAFDLLHALLRSPGTLVAKEALVREVWPSTFVDESNLRFQMACLRKALGSERHLIKTVPGRGYVFTGECRRAEPRPERPGASQVAATGSPQEIGGSAKILNIPIVSPGMDPGAERPLVSTGVWYLACLPIVLASNANEAAPAEEAQVENPRHCDVAGTAAVELLVPLFVNGDHSAARLRKHGSPRPPMAMDLDCLMRLLSSILPEDGGALARPEASQQAPPGAARFRSA